MSESQIYLTTGRDTKGRLLAILSRGQPRLGDGHVEILTLEIVQNRKEARAWMARMMEERPWESRNFPAEWGPESDGLNGDGSYHDDTVYVGLPLSADECDPPHWRFRLSDLVQSAIDLHKNPVTDRVEDAEGRAAIGRIKRGLTACMAMLDEAVCASPEKQ